MLLVRKIALLLASLLVSALLLEVAAHAIHFVRLGVAFPRAQVRERLTAVETSLPSAGPPPELRRNVARYTVHPYLGYVLDHSLQPHMSNRFGFRGAEPVSASAQSDDVVIAILGGSVAKGFGYWAPRFLVNRLRAAPAFAGREIRVVVLALGAYKQPQQLLALSYHLALGAEYDIVINLDGYNEVALPYDQFVREGAAGTFPTHWDLLARQSLDQTTVQLIVEIQDLRDRQTAWRRWSGHRLLGRSAAALTFLDAIDRRLQTGLVAGEEALRKRAASIESGAPRDGRLLAAESSDQLMEEAVRIWKRGSLQIAALCEAAGIDYYHFLQPNQYVPGSKPMGPAERRLAIVEGTRKTAVEEGYPALRAAGGQLLERGVHFTDLTAVFAGERRPLYSDACCHFNPTGMRLLAARISEVILARGADPVEAPTGSPDRRVGP